MTLNILGTEYRLEIRAEDEDPALKKIDGYCDKTIKLIVVSKASPDCDLGDYDVYLKKVIRHEILHAYLFESGLHENFVHPEYGHDETFIDWVAVQFPKILETFKAANCI